MQKETSQNPVNAPEDEKKIKVCNYSDLSNKLGGKGGKKILKN